jgi:hypothetical protein
LKSVIEMRYIGRDASEGVCGLGDLVATSPDLKRTTPMTIEILYLTAQIQRWLNERIARHLAAQAAKLDH